MAFQTLVWVPKLKRSHEWSLGEMRQMFHRPIKLRRWGRSARGLWPVNANANDRVSSGRAKPSWREGGEVRGGSGGGYSEAQRGRHTGSLCSLMLRAEKIMGVTFQKCERMRANSSFLRGTEGKWVWGLCSSETRKRGRGMNTMFCKKEEVETEEEAQKKKHERHGKKGEGRISA